MSTVTLQERIALARVGRVPGARATAGVVVLVPAYEPDARLVELVAALRAQAPERPVVVVDDGSGPAFADVFTEATEAGAVVLAHAANRGKGAALRAGLAHVREAYPGAGVVTADSDGQHTPADVARVATRLAAGEHDVVLGVRRFTGEVPLRSRIGNAVTRRLFALVTGQDVVDTQTGLRGYPASMLPWVEQVRGDRFDHELRVLLRAAREERSIGTVDIDTVYLEGNASSHFRPLLDSVSVYLPLLAFTLSSLLGFVVDLLAVLALMALTGQLVVAVVGARLLSASVNFTVNRRWVFARGLGGERTRAPLRPSLQRYAALAVAVLALNLALVEGLVTIGLSLLVAKVLTELALFVGGYVVQRTLVFARA